MRSCSDFGWPEVAFTISLRQPRATDRRAFSVSGFIIQPYAGDFSGCDIVIDFFEVICWHPCDQFPAALHCSNCKVTLSLGFGENWANMYMTQAV